MNIQFKITKYQIGISMVEAMISLLIFTIGSLGLAALQLSSLSAATDNEQRTLAVWKSQELTDRIKSNPGLEDAYITRINNNGENTLGVDSDAGLFVCPAAAPPICSAAGGADCTDPQIVDSDVWEVLCDANSGVASVADASSRVFGSSGFNQLEVILRRLPEDNDGIAGDDGTGDIELIFEWVSQEAERSDGIVNNTANGGTGAAIKNVRTNVCGNVDLTAAGGDNNSIAFNSRLDVYCMRFR